MLDSISYRRAPADAPPACPAPEDAGVCSSCAARALSVCGRASDAAVQRLSQLTETLTLKSGDVLAREGDPADAVFNVTAGAVRVYKLMSDGRRQIVGFLFPGDFLGLSPSPDYAYTAEAIAPTRVCRFTRKSYLGVAAEYPELESALFSRSSDELAAAQEHMLLLGRKTAGERVASFLLDLSARAARRGENGDIVVLAMTRGDGADYLGLTLETVSRILSSMKTRRLLRQLSPDSYAILDREALRRMAGR